jgi:hypothetical protein
MGSDNKKCLICGEYFPATTDYFYKNKSSKDGLNSYCKECTKKKSYQWQLDNRERHNEWMKGFFKSEKGKKLRKKDLEDGKMRSRKWQKENPDKVRHHNLKWQMNKKHEISEDEWESCLDYFNYSCAYCGITQDESIKLYNQRLHKEHVDSNGANDISNNIPACRKCNSSKRTYSLNEWYNNDNTNYSKRRYNKIIKWLMSFCEE